METYYFGADKPAGKASGPQYILANGDTTGFGLHADLCVIPLPCFALFNNSLTLRSVQCQWLGYHCPPEHDQQLQEQPCGRTTPTGVQSSCSELRLCQRAVMHLRGPDTRRAYWLRFRIGLPTWMRKSTLLV